MILLFFWVEVVRVGSTLAYGYLFSALGQKVMQDLRLLLFHHLQKLPLSVFDRNPSGRLVTRVTNDISALAEMFSVGFVAIVGNCLVVLGILIWLICLNLKIGLIILSVLPPMIALSIYFSRLLKVAYRDTRSKLSTLNAFFAENILGMRIVHLFNRQARQLERFDRVNQWFTDSQLASVRVFAFFQPTITLFAGLAMALVIVMGGRYALAGELKVGVLVACFSYVLSLFQPMREIADKWNIFLSGMASAERIFSVLEWAPEAEMNDISLCAVPLKGIKGHIVFEGVSFAYLPDRWVLNNLSAEIKPGSRVGIVGATGSGKTTLIHLLLRFYDPQKGRILLDGKDLRDYDKRSLRACIGMIQQDIFLFSGTLKENIHLWREPVGEKMRTVLRRKSEVGSESEWVKPSAAERVPHSAPDAFESLFRTIPSDLKLQERGANLSMGQRQILAFARAASAQPSLWILDEATANIDEQTEKLVEKELRNVSRGSTVILVAHRLATVKDCDQILVLNKGYLIEQGNHAELTRLGGIYAKLQRFQSGANFEGTGTSGRSQRMGAGAALNES